MVENKITKLKKLIDEHFENIENIIKQTSKIESELESELNRLITEEINNNYTYYSNNNIHGKLILLQRNKKYKEILNIIILLKNRKNKSFPILGSRVRLGSTSKSLNTINHINNKLINLLKEELLNPDLKQMMQLLKNIKNDLDNINSEFKGKNIKSFSPKKTNLKSAEHIINGLAQGVVHEISNSLKSDKIIDLSTEFQDIENFIYKNDKSDEDYINITETIYFMIKNINALHVDYNLSEILLNLDKIKVLLIINNPSIIYSINEIEKTVNMIDNEYTIKLSKEKKKNLNYHINLIKELLKNKNIVNYDEINLYINQCISVLECNKWNPLNINFLGYDLKNNIMCNLQKNFLNLRSFFLYKIEDKIQFDQLRNSGS